MTARPATGTNRQAPETQAEPSAGRRAGSPVCRLAAIGGQPGPIPLPPRHLAPILRLRLSVSLFFEPSVDLTCWVQPRHPAAPGRRLGSPADVFRQPAAAPAAARAAPGHRRHSGPGPATPQPPELLQLRSVAARSRCSAILPHCSSVLARLSSPTVTGGSRASLVMRTPLPRRPRLARFPGPGFWKLVSRLPGGGLRPGHRP